jgi:hypothetical protein
MNGFQGARARLRAANPLRLEDAPGPDSPQAAALLERILATDPEPSPRRIPRHRRSWRRRLWVLLPVAALASAAGYGILHRVTQPLVVACYSQPALSARPAVVPPGGEGPLAACEQLWQPAGTFNEGGQAEVPTLTACVLDNGVVAVFPRRKAVDTCADLGLAPFDGSTKAAADNARLARAVDAISDQFLSRCVDHDEAVAIVQRALANEGLIDWHVANNGTFSPETPCASLAAEPGSHTLIVAPVRDST